MGRPAFCAAGIYIGKYSIQSSYKSNHPIDVAYKISYHYKNTQYRERKDNHDNAHLKLFEYLQKYLLKNKIVLLVLAVDDFTGCLVSYWGF